MPPGLACSAICTVALRKESVDRNVSPLHAELQAKQSLSARRAWIEIFLSVLALGIPTVALRKESVDRNMRWVYARLNVIAVALRKESVDRNGIVALLLA